MKKIIIYLFFTTFCFNLVAQEDFKLIDSKKVILEGYNLYEDGEYEKAIKKYDLVHKNDTNYLLAQYEKALTLNALGDYEECVTICEDFIANKNNIGNENESYVYNLLGSTLDDMGYPDESIKILNQGLEKYPEFTSFKLNKAVTLKQAERYDESLEAFKQLLKDNPFYSNAHLHIGLLAADEEKNTQALMSFYLSTICAMTVEKLIYLDEYAQSNLKAEPKNLKLNKDITDDNYEEIDLIIQNKVALSKSYKTPTSFDFPFIKQLYAILEQLEYDKDDNGFWMQYYVPYFIKLKEDNQTENFVYFLMGISNDEAIMKKVQRYLPNMKEYYRWHLDTWSELHAKKTATIMGETKKFSHHYDDQKLNAIGEFDSNNKLTGPWMYFHENGKVLSYGMHKDGKRQGEWHFFNENGTKDAVFNYKDGDVDGDFIEYNKYGLLLQKGSYKNKKINGKLTNYFKDGSPAKEWVYDEGTIVETSNEYYKNGSKKYLINYNEDNEIDGEVKYFYPSGELKSIMNWKNDKREGKNIYYFINGDISSDENYEDNELEGDYVSYYSNKQISLKANFKDGKKIGESIEYYRSGDINAKNFFDENGKKSGTVEGYSPNGFKVNEYDYSKGEITGYRHYDKEGNIVREVKKKGSKLDYIFIYDNGQIKSEGLLKKDKNEGLWKYYNKNGSLSAEVAYENGEKNGVTKNYYLLGNIQSEMYYEDGNLEKMFKYYYKDGSLLKKGNYVNGLAQGEWVFYHENGKVSDITYYLNDDQHGIQVSFDHKGVLQEAVLYDRGTIIEKYTFDLKGEPNDTIYYNFGTVDASFKDVVGNTIRKGKYVNGNAEGEHIYYQGKDLVKVSANYLLGERHGDWKWYDDGKLISTTTYINGDAHGADMNYYKDGTKKSELYYDYGNSTGTWKYFYENGNLRRDMPHQNHSRHGTSNYYDPNGVFQYAKIHDNGYLIGYTYQDKDGKLKEMIPVKNETVKIEAFFPNGKKSAEVEIKFDMHMGEVKMYYENGQIESNVPFKDGDNHGLMAQYYEDGTVKAETNYAYDNKHGKEIKYYANGKVKEELTYIHGIKFGKATFYNELGKKIKEQEFYDNQIINEIIF